MSEKNDNCDSTLPLERLAELGEPQRTSCALAQTALVLKLLGRELKRRGVREEMYTAFELDHSPSVRITPDDKGNYLASIA